MDNQLLYAAVSVWVELYDKGSGATLEPRKATGFIVQGKDSSQHHLLSNRHFLDPGWGDSQYIRFGISRITARLFSAQPGRPDLVPNTTHLIDVPLASLVHLDDDTIDLSGAPLRRMIPVGAPARVTFFVPYTMIADSSLFATLLHAGETVFFPGYPMWFDHNGDRPILRYGAIISDPRTDYRLETGPAHRGDGNQQFAFEALSVSGNSGSPVFSVERGLNLKPPLESSQPYRPVRLIGINAGHYDAGASQHSGISRAHKSTAILELIEKLDQS